MTQEKEKQEIQAFFQNPWYHLIYRHALTAAANLRNTRNEDERETILKTFCLEDDFMTRFTYDYSFYQHIRKSMMSTESYWNQISELGYLILLDLLHPKAATPKNAEITPIMRVEEREIKVKRLQNPRRTRRRYPEIFFSTERKAKTGRRTRTFTCFSTIFNEMPLENESHLPTAIELLRIQDEGRFANIGKANIDSMRLMIANLRMVDSNDLSGLTFFGGSLIQSLEAIADTFHQSTDKVWLLSAIKNRTNVVEQIYQLVDLAVALRKFKVKSEDKKERLLKQDFDIKCSLDDVTKAVELNFEWFEDPVQAADLVFRGATAYNQIEKMDTAIALYEECLKQPSLQKEDKALCYHDIAANYMHKKNPRKYLIWLKKALAAFEELDSPFDVGITWAHIAEAYQLLGNKPSFEMAKQKSKSNLSTPKITNCKVAQAYVLVADCAERLKDTDWEKEAVNIGLEAASKSEDLEYFPYLDQRRHFLKLGIDTIMGEMRPGGVRRPPMFRWRKDSTRYVAISPTENSST